MKCPYCKSENNFTYYRVKMPTIYSACPKSMLDKVKTCPLEVRLCRSCLLGFNAIKLDENEVKMIYNNYSYISPTQGIGYSKFKRIIEITKKYCLKNDRIVEIGCSDGYFLKMLKKDGYKNLIGIEPSHQAEQAKQIKGLTIIKNYFDEKMFIAESVDVFVLAHVFEHFPDPFSILDAMKKQLSLSGKIIIEIPNFGEFEHQHLFYYNLSFLKKMCNDKELKIVEASVENDILLIVIVHKANETFKETKITQHSDQIITLAIKRYNDFKKEIEDLNQFLRNFENRIVYWWGAGTLSAIYLNQVDQSIRESVQIIVIDGDKNKWGKYIPGVDLLVNSYEILRDRTINCLIVASSFYHEILDTMKANRISANTIEAILPRY